MTTEPHEAFISDKIAHGGLPVTFRTLSRSQKIHIDEAKAQLELFYQKNRDKLHATYLITGKSNDATLVKLSTDVENDKKLFTSVSKVWIYSLSRDSASGADLALENSHYPAKLEEAEDYYRCGMLKGPEIQKEAVITETKIERRTDSDQAKTKSDVKSPSEKAPTEAKKPTKSAGLSSNYKSRKGEKAAPQASKPASVSKPKYEYKSRKPNQKERVVVSNQDDGVDEIEETAQRKAPPSTDLATLFDGDDDWDFSDNDKETEETESSEKKAPKENTTEEAMEVEPQESVNESEKDSNKMQEDKSKEDEENEMDIDIPETANAPNSPSLFVEDEVVTTVDNDGYFTSVKKTAPTPKPARPATKKSVQKKTTIKSGKNQKKQASIFDMFKK